MSQWITPRIGLIVLAAALLAALGFETDWGASLMAPPVSLRPVNPKQDAAGVLPDFKLSGDSGAYGQIAEHPLLSPTRKPAPTQVVQAAPEPAKPQIRRGLYQLVGITDFGALKVAQVREVGSNRVKSVREGDLLQELLVQKIESNRLNLTFAGEQEILELAKFTASGRVAQAPAPPPMSAQPPPQPQPPVQPQAASVVQQTGPRVLPAGAPPMDSPSVAAAPQLKFPGAGEGSPIPGRVSVAEMLEARRNARANQ